MATEWKAQIGDGKYAIQFETNNYDWYKIVEKACQKAVEEARKRVCTERTRMGSSCGHL